MTMPSYDTKLESIAIAGVNNLFIRSLLDRQQYHDPEGEAQRLGIGPAIWPLFGLLWPSALHLAEHLARRPVCPDEKILEVGCGLGLASLVGHRRGARITASDCHPLTETFLQENLRLNDLCSSLKYRHGQWGLNEPMSDDEAGRPVLSGRYDLVIGSDLLYERDMPQALSAFIDQHARPEAEVWIVDQNRGYRPAFNRHMADYGFELFKDKRLVNDAASNSGSPPYTGRILKYTR
ncbi:MAG TPA: SAM-dependent methyltransferase [Pusillimonas sp.]|uniref:class I SAM-dependent methyltransferase n=1 Tax=Pusillimonas sp. TaxID=3040095 RepID=UPI002B7BC6A9|nr:SAM-dependent methyltransferase [Pusillimonas sp.]HUH86551.1 SAM-dependent methyltransferase [Pusillimonas sp.]